MNAPVPLPGQHLRSAEQPLADPDRIRAEVDELLGGLNAVEGQGDGDAIPHRARVLEQAHDVLVRALATVDKI
ncbi:hypothetical protein OG921_12635 [Aldersonia sp. NBC_00410]|jgi:hypothetical protein|uniref:hypothetical protein n=1 Tax=Aldersonia sp. NBC_00410 TaxID=2975954 RepID=UPI0022558A1F|nr:hypothetical protein [Aldersonia sp. NBC_00410]MCX5044016.1 hypothetical protein [Aldersonia sp. NBC_00410]